MVARASGLSARLLVSTTSESSSSKSVGKAAARSAMTALDGPLKMTTQGAEFSLCGRQGDKIVISNDWKSQSSLVEAGLDFFLYEPRSSDAALCRAAQDPRPTLRYRILPSSVFPHPRPPPPQRSPSLRVRSLLMIRRMEDMDGCASGLCFS